MAKPTSSVVARFPALTARLRMDLISTPAWRLVFKLALLVFAATNIKNFFMVWHWRVFRTIVARLVFKPKRQLDPNCLLLPAITTSRAPLLETDFNLHKSNSTYLTDVDICRANYAAIKFGSHVAQMPWHRTRPVLILGGVQTSWRKEIPPYKEYEMWTRSLAWDDKWYYAITHFVEKGRFKPQNYLQSSISSEDASNLLDGAVKSKAELQSTNARAIYASVVSRVICKQGRTTIKPEELMKRAGLFPESEEARAKLEEHRKRNLSLIDGPGGWDALHATFFDNTALALGSYGSL